MNSILEALRKSSQAPPPPGDQPQTNKGFLFQKSPYDSASVYWERRRMNDDKGLRRTVRAAVVLAAASVLTTVALIGYVVYGLDRQSRQVENLPQPEILVVTVTPTPAAVEQPPVEQPPAPVAAQANMALPDERPLPLDLPEQDDLAIIEPNVTPRPLDFTKEPPLPESGKPMPRQTPAPDRGAYRLQGIIWDPQSPMAMVNGRSVHTGDKIGEAKVVQINRSTVVLDVDGERITLK